MGWWGTPKWNRNACLNKLLWPFPLVNSVVFVNEELLCCCDWERREKNIITDMTFVKVSIWSYDNSVTLEKCKKLVSRLERERFHKGHNVYNKGRYSPWVWVLARYDWEDIITSIVNDTFLHEIFLHGQIRMKIYSTNDMKISIVQQCVLLWMEYIFRVQYPYLSML